jgi:outer membrane protein assembly factor BamB
MAAGGDRHVTDRRRAAVYVGGSDGWLPAIDGATGRERWRVGLGGVLVSSPAVHGGNVYLGGTQGLAALGGQGSVLESDLRAA